MRSWQWIGRALGVGYALLWALVLPFICWGAWAAPGHPHRAPHFVFAKPTLAHAHSHLASLPLSYLHATDPTPAHSAAQDCHGHDHGEVAGVAHPESLVVMLLGVLLPAALPWLRPRGPHFPQWAVPLRAADRPLAPPTPPPRHTAADPAAMSLAALP